MKIERRGFLAAPLLAAAPVKDPVVVAYGDGVPLSPTVYSEILSKAAMQLKPDNYSLGGIVEQLEAHMAAELGKEFAVWLPTGTLANHLALRILCGNRKRALVQAEAHLYNDCGDCCQNLSGLNLIPLAPGRATFTLAEVEEANGRSNSGRVKTPVGAIQIESPVRRRTGETFDFAEMRRISHWAREQSIGMHLDGARLYMGSAYTGVAVKDYAALFDTVYVSMYKYFGAASGAILAGPKAQLAELFQMRRMFGGGLHEAWPLAAVAYQNVKGFEARYSSAVKCSETVIASLSRNSAFRIERVKQGSNLFWLELPGRDLAAFRSRANQVGVEFAPPQGKRFVVGVNETWNRVSAPEMTQRLEKCLA